VTTVSDLTGRPVLTVVTTAAELRRLYEAGAIDEAELERRLERLAEREGVGSLTLSDPPPNVGPAAVEHGMTSWFAAALSLVVLTVVVPLPSSVHVAAVSATVIAVAAGIYSLAAYSYRRGSLPRAQAP